jgi:hypothetical protein
MHQNIYIYSLFVEVSYMFRPCWAIFRENSFATLWLLVNVPSCECALGHIHT